MGADPVVLQSIVDAARALFAARAASIAMVDPVSGDLVFAAVAGDEVRDLVGARFRAGEGIAGAVAASGKPCYVGDVGLDTRFARDVAEEIGYLPRTMLAAPLAGAGGTLGVLEVLDRGDERTSEDDLRLIEAFTAQAGLAVALSETARRLAAALERVLD